ncbi:MAG: tetratricopeptide repeat protein [Desulfosarcinaceae bacterium]|nr:tetratricopeptide repeat protein [Desulfosarcinaceae bacterium]
MQTPLVKSRLPQILLGLICLFCASAAASQASLLNQAIDHHKRGDYDKALQLYDQVPDPDRMAAVVGATNVRIMIGEYQRAERDLDQLLIADAENETFNRLLAKLLRLTGRSSDAIRVLEPIVGRQSASACSLVQYGDLLAMRGGRDTAALYFQRAISDYERGLIYDAAEVACVAEACRQMDRYQDANGLLREAARTEPENREIQALWGDLFYEKYNLAEAQRSYQQVLGGNDRHIPALVGMARTTGGSTAHAFLDTALDINPHSAAARIVRAGLLMEDGIYDKAADQLQQALTTNSESVDALALLAAIAFLNDDNETFQGLERKIAAFSPGNGAFYARIAEVCGRSYRFEEAVAMAEKAVNLDANNWNGHIVLGMNLLRLGREEAGRTHLETGFRGDPFHVWAKNMLGVLDKLDSYVTHTTKHFVVRMDPLDASVLWPYLKALLDESWQTLTAKYDFTPRGQILIEIFSDREDFAVRTSGLPNIGHLLGVCFGNVITLISPRAHTPMASINWQEVVWHEFVHVITLHMTNNRIPRWLSEGVSVFEENNGRPEWGRRQDIELIRAVQENRLIGINQLDAAFSEADNLADLNFAYYQSSLLVDFIVDRYGFDALKALIRRYAHNASQNDIFMSVLKISAEDLEARFFSWLKSRVQDINIHVSREAATTISRFSDDAPPSLEQRSKMQVAKLETQIAAQPRDFLARLQLGLILYANKAYEGAIQHLTVARALLPGYSASPNPRQILAAIHEERGDRPSMIREMEALVKIQQNAFDACFKLGQIAWSRNEEDRAIHYLERALAVNPYDPEVHRLLATIALQRSDYQTAVREFEVLLALDETDPALANTNLADAHYRNGDKALAKHHALAALEIAPMFDKAQEILLDAIEP